MKRAACGSAALGVFSNKTIFLRSPRFTWNKGGKCRLLNHPVPADLLSEQATGFDERALEMVQANLSL